MDLFWGCNQCYINRGWNGVDQMKFKSFQTILMFMLGVTSLSTFLLVFKTPSEEWPMWSDDGEAAPIVADEGVRLRTVEPVAPPPLETLAQVQTINTSSISKPTLYVLTTGVRHFQAPQAFTTTTVMGQVQTATVGPTFDEGYGPQEWPEGAKRVVDGMVTIWMKIAAECSGWCFVSEDDAIWPNGIPSELPSDGFVSFFKEAVCAQATGAYSENYDSVVKAVIPGKCMPYGAVAYAITGNFAKMLLSNLPMSKPVDHFLWEQAVVQKKAYVSRRYVVRHKKGKSLRQNTVQHPPPNADNPVPMLHNNSGYILYKDVVQLGSDIGKPVADARGVCSRTPSCVGYNHMGWMKSSVGNVHKRKGMSLYVKRKHSLQMYPSEAFKQPTIDCNLEFNGPVDVVYTWVNWTHPAYIAQMRANGIFDGETKEPNMNYDRTATSDSYNELRYSMASLLQNDKKEQIRNIYVVINPIHGPPSWLNISHPRIKIIHHNILLPQTPTNNAWAIQTCLHRIPDLSPWFLALNDDVILNRPLKLSSKEISCPRGEITQTHCPTLRNTCLMGQLETHFQKEVDQVYNYRKKSTLEYRPEIILWLEHHNWLVANGHAVVAVTDWFGKMNTNGWRHDPKWVGETWQRVIEKEGRKTWLNFQGQGISWEYPENPTIRSLFNAWIHNQHYPLHSAFFKKNPQTPHHTIIDDADRANSSDMPNIEHFPKIAVAIPTYNRAGYVQLCAAALNKTIDPNDVWIFDDHSTEYTAGDLQKWFGSHSVQRNAKRFKADKQARHILEWFVGTDYDWLITLDSDLIVRPDWLELLRGMLPHTQGVMSLYHSGNPNHPTLHCDPNLCEMKSLGNAGVAWSKVLAKKMLVDMTQSDGFDWGWTEWLRKQKIPQYAAKDSLVLHVGMHGTWGADSKREKSVGFPMDKLSPDVRGRAELFLKGMQ